MLGFHKMGLETSGYLKVSLSLTNMASSTPMYYVTVKATNRAGKESSVMSSR